MRDPVTHVRSRALLIATAVSADPVIPAMPTAAGSLAGMREVLTDPALCGWPGTSVTSVPDAGDPRALLRTFRTLAGEAGETLLFYFAGPGILLKHDELCLSLAGTRLDDVEDSSLPYARVRRAVLKSHALLKVVILDCSYSGRVIPGPPAIRVAEMTSINETYVLTASDREADPGDAAASAFTAELIATIRAGIPDGHRGRAPLARQIFRRADRAHHAFRPSDRARQPSSHPARRRGQGSADRQRRPRHPPRVHPRRPLPDRHERRHGRAACGQPPALGSHRPITPGHAA